MVRAIALFLVSAVLVIGAFSFIAVHVEAMIYTRSFIPSSFFPVEALRGHGVSIGLVIAAGLGAAVHDFIFKRLFVQRWGLVDEAQSNKLHGKG